jgi:hypothetical protein
VNIKSLLLSAFSGAIAGATAGWFAVYLDTESKGGFGFMLIVLLWIFTAGMGGTLYGAFSQKRAVITGALSGTFIGGVSGLMGVFIGMNIGVFLSQNAETDCGLSMAIGCAVGGAINVAFLNMLFDDIGKFAAYE